MKSIKKNYTYLFIATFLLFANSINAHFGSKGPFGGAASSTIVYDSTIYVGTVNGSVFQSSNTGLIAWKPMPVGLKSGKITALTHTGKYLFAATADSGVFIFTGYVGTDRYWKKINTGLTNLNITSLVAIDSITVMAGTTGGGIFMTTNKGANWTTVNNAVLHHYDITGLVKADNRIIHISDGGVWASDDKGVSWLDINDINTLHVETNAISYNATTNEILISNTDGLFIADSASTDSSVTYQLAINGLPANTVIRGISNNGTHWYLATDKGVFVSAVGTINWVAENTNLPTLNVNTIVPFQARLVVGTNGEGVFKSSNNSISWIACNNGLNNLRTYSMLTAGVSLVVASTEKGVYVSKDLATTYQKANHGLTDSLNVNDLTLYGTSLIAVTKNAGVFITADTGKTWAVMNTGLTNMNIKKTFVLAGKLYIFDANGHVFEYNASTWSAIQGGLPVSVVPSSMAFIGNKLFLSTLGNGVYTKTITATTWSAANTGLTNLNATSITASTNKLFIGTDGNGVFVSDTATISWSATSPTSIAHTVTMGLDGTKIQAMAYNAGYVFASYKGGLLATSDNGLTWIAGGNQFNLPSYTNVDKVSFVTTRVFVTSEYNSLYSNALTELPVITTGINEQPQEVSFNIFPNPNNGSFMIDLKNSAENIKSVSVYNNNGQLVECITNKNWSNAINLQLNHAKGIYYIQINTGKELFTKKLIFE